LLQLTLEDFHGLGEEFFEPLNELHLDPEYRLEFFLNVLLEQRLANHFSIELGT